MTATTPENLSDAAYEQELAEALVLIGQTVADLKQIVADDRWPETVRLIPASVARDLHRSTSVFQAVCDSLPITLAADERGE